MPPALGSRFFTAQSTVGKGLRALVPEGRQREGRAEPDPWESRPTLRASPRHRPTAHAYCNPADCASVPWRLLIPAQGSFPLPVVGCSSANYLCVSHLRAAWFLKGHAAPGLENMLGRSHLHFSWKMDTSGLGSWVLTFALCLRWFLTFWSLRGLLPQPAHSSSISLLKEAIASSGEKEKSSPVRAGFVQGSLF